MDIEWAKDGETGEIAIVQARPETVESRREAGSLKTWRLHETGELVAKGLAVGGGIAVGKVRRLESPGESEHFPEGAVLVTRITDPDWVPVMKKAAAIVTEHGGRTSHAAIVSRELGLPAVVGTGDAMSVLRDEQLVTVSCVEGDEGHVYEGAADFDAEDLHLQDIPETDTKVMLNVANPVAAFRWWRLPADGVGLARMEFIVGTLIKVHPMALVQFDRVKDPQAREEIAALTRGYEDRGRYFVDRLAYGIGRIAAAWYPRKVIVRTSDFKTNEYANLIGGQAFEPHEENPMLGWRGASRYYDEGYRQGFALECAALRKVRGEMGLTNVVVMIPFCRSPEEADRVLAVMAESGLKRGEHGLEVYVMCEIPSNVILADRFAERFDGFSIGSNDLTQLTLGVDRDSSRLAGLFDESDAAVTTLIEQVVARAHAAGRKVGFCGQAPSNRPAYAEFLVRTGIDSISVTPDSFVDVKRHVAEAEASRGKPIGDGVRRRTRR
jgi:pyruvate,water dikinase